jgi:hypothetical protein
MNCYRIFLLRQDKITAHHEFGAENDTWAGRAAALAFDACSECCDDFELWYGVHLVTTCTGLKTRATIAEADEARAGAMVATLDGAIERIAARILEGAMATSGALRESPRLNARLSALRRPPAGPR